MNWHIAMQHAKHKALDTSSHLGGLVDKAEKIKASIRAKVEHPFRVIKRQFLPAGAVAGWDLHPLESAALSQRTPKAEIR